MKRYGKYKQSGIEWIGEIPSHWNYIRIKFLSPVKRGASPRPIEDPRYFDDNGEYSWVRIADVSASERYLEKTTQKLSELGASLSVKREVGDFFLSIAGTVGKPIITKIKCCIHDGFVWFPSLRIDPEFLYYIFQTGLPYQGLGKLGTQLNLNTETVGNISVAHPPQAELATIVKYLDYKTQQIDDLIAKKEQLIKLLEEERTALINELVTGKKVWDGKGFSKPTKTKDSGIDWLGEIPEDWQLYRVDWLCKIVRGNSSFKRDELLPQGKYIALQYGKTYKVQVVDDSFKFYVNEEFYKENQVIEKGDTVIISTSETIEDLGHTCFYNHENIGLLGGEQIALKPNIDIITEEFLFQYASQLGAVLRKYAKGLKVLRFNTQDLKRIFIAIPSKKAQHQISTYLNKEQERMHRLSDALKSEIKLLTEYKSSLISEVVTGKVDVRDEVIPT